MRNCLSDERIGIRHSVAMLGDSSEASQRIEGYASTTAKKAPPLHVPATTSTYTVKIYACTTSEGSLHRIKSREQKSASICPLHLGQAHLFFNSVVQFCTNVSGWVPVWPVVITKKCLPSAETSYWALAMLGDMLLMVNRS